MGFNENVSSVRKPVGDIVLKATHYIKNQLLSSLLSCQAKYVSRQKALLSAFCGIDHQKFSFPLISDTLSVGGCWDQPILLLKKLVDATQILKPPQPTTHHSSIKLLILLPLRADLLCTLQYETPCKLSNSALRNSVAITALAQVLAILLSTLHIVSFH